MTTLCESYTIGSPTTVWPIRKFMRSWFRGWADQRLKESERAWNLFEKVESYDATIRVRRSQGQTTAEWYRFTSEGERMIYRDGKVLHQLACPSIVWTPQRYLSIPSTPITDVRPAICAKNVSECVQEGRRKITAY
jgi:hypothetical protein